MATTTASKWDLLGNIDLLNGGLSLPQAAQQLAPQAYQQSAVYTPVNYNLGETGYNPQDIGPLSYIADTAQNRFKSLLNQPLYGTGQENSALQRGLQYGPYFSYGAPAQSLNFLQTRAPFAESNPYLQSYMRAAAQPLLQDYTENILPAIGDRFSMSGMTGSSRHGIAEGIAARGVADAISRSNLALANQGYETGIGAMQNALGMGAEDYSNTLSRMLDAYSKGGQQNYIRSLAETGLLGGAEAAGNIGLMPSQVIGSIGSQRQQQTQQAINDAMARWDYTQNYPYNQLNQFASLINGANSAGYNAQSQSAPSSLLGNIAGTLGTVGAISGSLGSIFGGGGAAAGAGAAGAGAAGAGAAMNPYVAAALIGAGLFL